MTLSLEHLMSQIAYPVPPLFNGEAFGLAKVAVDAKSTHIGSRSQNHGLFLLRNTDFVLMITIRFAGSGHGYPKTPFKREPDTDKDIPSEKLCTIFQDSGCEITFGHV